MHSLFTYGSLMFPRVWELVTSGSHRREPARVFGFCRRVRRCEVYPVLVPGDEIVEGILYSALAEAELLRLDVFEGEDYERRQVVAETAGGHAVGAWVYLLKADRLELADGPWDPERFRREGLPRFLKEYQGFKG